MRLLAQAKINLSLRVFEKRSDGFHRLESLMQSVSLCDYLTLDLIPSGIELTTNNKQLTTDADNLAYKAAEVFGAKGIRIHLEKQIPIAAGLAGGSADAAAVLYGLNQMTNDETRMTNECLITLGQQLGSDVPFCLTGGTCSVKGCGEVVAKQPDIPKTYYILVCPDIAVSTKWAYEEFDRVGQSNAPGTENDLEPVVIKKYPELQTIKNMLKSLGCDPVQMSGSGPTVFGQVKRKAEAQMILERVKQEYSRSFLVKSVNCGVRVK